MPTARRLAGATCALALAALGCSAAQRIAFEKGMAEALISDEQEQALGLQVHQELQTQNVKFVTDPEVQGYVERLVQTLQPYADRDRGQTWHVFVVDDLKTNNAFATPGGRVYVYSGLLAFADDEPQVVGVLGHEMGHVVARHSARKLIAQYGLAAVADAALGKNPSLLKQIATLGGQGLLLAHSRAEETEADEHGVRYAALSGFQARGIAAFFEKLKAQSQGLELPAFLSTHPPHAERIAAIDAYIAQSGLPVGGPGGPGLKAVQVKLGVRK